MSQYGLLAEHPYWLLGVPSLLSILNGGTLGCPWGATRGLLTPPLLRPLAIVDQVSDSFDAGTSVIGVLED